MEVIIWPAKDELAEEIEESIIQDQPPEKRAVEMALSALAEGATRVRVVPKRFWGRPAHVCTQKEIRRAYKQARPFAYMAKDGNINVGSGMMKLVNFPSDAMP